jgi:hypothetical protein
VVVHCEDTKLHRRGEVSTTVQAAAEQGACYDDDDGEEHECLFHQVNLVSQEESRSPKFILGSDIACIWVWRSLRTSHTFAELSGIYTQHFVLISA